MTQQEMADMLKAMQAKLAEADVRIAAAKAEGIKAGKAAAKVATLEGCDIKVNGRTATITLDLDHVAGDYKAKDGKTVILGPGIYKGGFGATFQLTPELGLRLSTFSK